MTKITLVEVGPRDGLQNEKEIVSLEDKITFIRKLMQAGHKVIEVGGFVSPKWVPQLSDSDQVLKALLPSDIRLPVLVPNMKGFEAAMAAGASEISLFGAVSESFSQKNINCSIAESIERFKPVIAAAKNEKMRVRGYVSCVWGCPYEGKIAQKQALDIIHKFSALGFDEISLGDTIGTGTAFAVRDLLKCLEIPKEKLAVHFHDTYGQALANILVSLEEDIRIIDSSVAGLGGCPYAKGASGNVATEDVLYLLQGLGYETGVEMQALIEAGNFILDILGKETSSKVAKAMSAKRT